MCVTGHSVSNYIVVSDGEVVQFMWNTLPLFLLDESISQTGLPHSAQNPQRNLSFAVIFPTKWFREAIIILSTQTVCQIRGQRKHGLSFKNHQCSRNQVQSKTIWPTERVPTKLFFCWKMSIKRQVLDFTIVWRSPPPKIAPAGNDSLTA